MKLSENTKVVNALKRILEDYSYLAYNVSRPQRIRESPEEVLHVDVIDEKPDCADRDVKDIIKKLEHTTGRCFKTCPGSGPRDFRLGDVDKQWGYFRIRKRKKP